MISAILQETPSGGAGGSFSKDWDIVAIEPDLLRD
jgi:hypothetical protein